MTNIAAKVILASHNADDPEPGRDLVTMLVKFPRCILAEFNTHRAFSRNAASSRAIPVEKMIQSVIDDPFIPLYWGANQKGMQAAEECNALIPTLLLGKITNVTRDFAWLEARDQAIDYAQRFSNAGYHKQLVNRLLEPWMMTRVVVTSSEWQNFFDLRLHKDAEPHMRLLAQAMWEARAAAPVQNLQPGEWHIPFITEDDWVEIVGGGVVTPDQTNAMLKLSVARCASVSYKTVDNLDMTPERAVALYDKLAAASPLHASPFEHQAQADSYFGHATGSPYKIGEWIHPNQHRNFVGWKQYRAMIEKGLM